MTGEQYIYEKNNRFRVIKSIKGNNKIFGNYGTLEEAIFARDLLIGHDWNLDEIIPSDNVIKFNDEFMVITAFKGALKFLNRFQTRNDAKENASKLIMEFERNPYGSKYGTYIYKREDYFDVKKKINNKDVLFGSYTNLNDATFARDLLADHDWDLTDILNEGPVFFSQIHDKYVVVNVNNGKLMVIKYYELLTDAIVNAEDDIKNNTKSKHRTGEKNIVFNGKLFAIHYTQANKKVLYFGSFSEKIDAISVRDILIEHNWDLSQIDENEIYDVNGYYWKLHIFEGRVKVIGKYESLGFAKKDINNLSSVTFEQLYDPGNPYSKANRYIWKRSGKFWIRKKIEGDVQFLGPYDTREDAIKARDEYELNGWQLDNYDEESIFSNDLDDDDFEEIVSNLSLWQRIIYDTIVRIGKVRFSLDELLNHSYLKCYKSGENFEGKVIAHLNELIDWGLVESLGDYMYLRKF